MPSLDFASGVLSGYFNTVLNERNRKEENALRAAQFLLQTGRVRNPNDLLPFLQPLMDQSPLGSVWNKGGKGKGKQGQQGQGDAWGVLSSFLNPMIQMGQAPGQAASPTPTGPSAGAGLPSPSPAPAPPPSGPSGLTQMTPTTPAAPQGPLMNDEEMLRRQLGVRQAEGQMDLQTDLARSQMEYQQRASRLRQINASAPPDEQIKGLAAREYLLTGKLPPFLRPTQPKFGPTSAIESLPDDIRTQDGRLFKEVYPDAKAAKYSVEVTPEGETKEYYVPADPAKAGTGSAKYTGEMRQLTDAFAALKSTNPEEVGAAKLVIERAQTNESLAIARLAKMMMDKMKLQESNESQDWSGWAAGPPDASIGDKSDPKLGGRSPNAIWQAAMAWVKEGKEPSYGIGAAPGSPGQLARSAVEGVAGAIAHSTGVDMSTIRAAYRAGSRTATQYTAKAAIVEQGMAAFEKNLQLVEQESRRVGRTRARMVNRWKQWFQNELTTAPDLTKLEVFIYTAAREYGRVASQQTGAGAMTDYATKEAERLISAVMSHQTLQAAADAMRSDLMNIREGIRETSRANFERLATPSAGAADAVRPPSTQTGGGRGAGPGTQQGQGPGQVPVYEIGPDGTLRRRQ